MKTKLITLLVVGLHSWCLLAQTQTNAPAPPAAPAAAAATEAAPTEPLPPIVTDEAPITDIIKFLARQANLNVLVDPRITSSVGPDGKPVPPPTVPPMRFEEVTARQALDAILNNYGMVLTVDPVNRIGRVTNKDPNAQEPRLTQVVSIKFGAQYSTNTYAITNLSAMISQNFPTSRIYADTRTSQLVINATEREIAQITNLLARLDVPVRQILIEARFVQTTQRPETMKGMDWTQSLEAQNVTFGNGLTEATRVLNSPGSSSGSTSPSGRPLSGGTGDSVKSELTTSVAPAPSFPGMTALTSGGTPQTFFLSADGVRAVLSFLNKDAESEFIANPQAVALEGQPTELGEIQNIPVFEEQQGNITSGSAQPNTVKPNYELKVGGYILNEVGVKLVVTPRVTGDTNVFMDLRPEISAQGPAEIKVLGGRRNEAPTFIRRKVTTQAIVPSGHTLVLGGLLSDLKETSNVKVPILGDLPVIGLAFRKDAKARNKKNLMIFVTPTIVEDQDFQSANDRGRGFLQNNKIEEKPDEKWSSWDSAKPHDWKKPVD